MSRYDAILFAVSLIGAFNSILITALWFARDKRSVLSDYWPYPALTALAGLIVLLIGGDHSGVTPRASALEWLITATSGPLLLDAVRRSVGLSAVRWAYLAAPASFVAALLFSPVLNLNPIILVICGQWLFTAISAWIWVQHKSFMPSRSAAAVLIVAFGFVHLAQALRITLPEIFRDVVPVSMAASFVVLTFVLLLRSRALGGWFRALDRNNEARTTITLLQNWLKETRAFASPELRLTEAAEAINIPQDTLSRRLNDQGQSFPDILARVRLDEAAKMLTSKDDVRTSVEAVGLLCGFSSRSGFYKAFNRRFGNTPAAYRKRRLQNKLSTQR